MRAGFAARLRIRVLLTAGMSLSGPTVSAQELPPLTAGVRMRAWLVERDNAVVGRLHLIGRDTLWLFVDSATSQAYPLELLDQLQVSRGKPPALTVGSLIGGALVGALIGPAVLTEPARCATELIDDPACRHETSDVLIGAAVGAVVLGWLGSRLAKERWREVPLALVRSR